MAAWYGMLPRENKSSSFRKIGWAMKWAHLFHTVFIPPHVSWRCACIVRSEMYYIRLYINTLGFMTHKLERGLWTPLRAYPFQSSYIQSSIDVMVSDFTESFFVCLLLLWVCIRNRRSAWAIDKAWEQWRKSTSESFMYYYNGMNEL